MDGRIEPLTFTTSVDAEPFVRFTVNTAPSSSLIFFPVASLIIRPVKVGASVDLTPFSSNVALYVASTVNSISSALLYPAGTVVSTSLYLPASRRLNSNVVCGFSSVPLFSPPTATYLFSSSSNL